MLFSNTFLLALQWRASQAAWMQRCRGRQPAWMLRSWPAGKDAACLSRHIYLKVCLLVANAVLCATCSAQLSPLPA